MADAIVKHLNFGNEAKDKIFEGISKLTKAVSSTLGASGQCVIMEDNQGRPIITKDGVTVANTIVLLDPVENMGATLIKEAARKTVGEAGDGTTTATVLAHSIIETAQEALKTESPRAIKEGINKAVSSVIKYLEKISVPVTGKMIDQVATISANNDPELGEIIGNAFKAVDETGVVMMETTDEAETWIDVVDGMQYDAGLKSSHFITDKLKGTSELNEPLVLIAESKIPNIRRIQNILEYVIKNKEALLIIGDIEPQVLNTLAMNNLQGNIKVNVIDLPTYGISRKSIMEDISLLTGAKILNEDLGDDMDVFDESMLGRCIKATTSDTETVLQVEKDTPEVNEAIEATRKELEGKMLPGHKVRLEKRLARLSAKVAIVKVGANSEVELKEKRDRVEDAICATKAAIKEGIVPGGGVALLNASTLVSFKSVGEKVLLDAIKAPYKTILANAGFDEVYPQHKGKGLNVVTGNMVNMIKSGIIDPSLVTKSALKNAASVATTILSTDCVINNLRINEGNR